MNELDTILASSRNRDDLTDLETAMICACLRVVASEEHTELAQSTALIALADRLQRK